MHSMLYALADVRLMHNKTWEWGGLPVRFSRRLLLASTRSCRAASHSIQMPPSGNSLPKTLCSSNSLGTRACWQVRAPVFAWERAGAACLSWTAKKTSADVAPSGRVVQDLQQTALDPEGASMLMQWRIVMQRMPGSTPKLTFRKYVHSPSLCPGQAATVVETPNQGFHRGHGQ